MLLLEVLSIVLALTAQAPAQTAAPAQPTAAEAAAVKLLQASDWTNAAPAFAALTKAEPANPRAWFGLGVSLHEIGRYAEARDALLAAQANQYTPPNQARNRLARTYAKLGDAAKALDTIDQMTASGFTNAQALAHTDYDVVRAHARFVAALDRINRALNPCQHDADFRKFDFWIGTWDVQPTGAPRAPIGNGATSVVERTLNGCVILENWKPVQGPEGKSFNIYNRHTKKWEQYWTDATGNITYYVGQFREDGSLFFEAAQFGSANLLRMTFFNQGPNQVRQLGHISTDGGKTWSGSFDLTYVRKPGGYSDPSPRRTST